ncbi:MAG: ABC transporter ATP-binding protein, partial [Longimicrobiales bacterium]
MESEEGKQKKKRVTFWSVRREAWALIVEHKRSLLIGFALMVIGRLAAFVLPGSSKYLIDTVIGQGRGDLLVPLALAAGGATLVQAATSFGLARVVS